MTQIHDAANGAANENIQSFLASSDAEPEWLATLPEAFSQRRQEARERFSRRGFPTMREEAWRQTNLGPIARSRRVSSSIEVTAEDVAQWSIEDCVTLVFVNGHFDASLSDEVPQGIDVGALSNDQHVAEPVREILGSLTPEDAPVAELNLARFGDAAILRLENDRLVEQPIQLLFLSASDDLDDESIAVSLPRVLVVAGRSSQATLVESHAGVGGRYLSAGVTELVLEANAHLRHYRVVHEAADGYHVSSVGSRLARDAQLDSYSITCGGALVRNDISSVLAGEGICCTLNGLYVGQGREHVDHHMFVEHAEPNCESHELFKGILQDRSRAVFNGRIYVHEGAQKTDAKQTNRNLLLSKDALVHSNPQLEIFADDVRCTHGSTIGRLDEDALFYLRSRGIDAESAQGILVHAFADELLDRIELDGLREWLKGHLAPRLPGGAS